MNWNRPKPNRRIDPTRIKLGREPWSFPWRATAGGILAVAALAFLLGRTSAGADERGMATAALEQAGETRAAHEAIRDAERAVDEAEEAVRAAEAAAAAAKPTALELLRRAAPGPDGRLQATLPDGRTATLSIEPTLQKKLELMLQDYDVPYGVSVAVEPETGRILAMAEYGRDVDAQRELTLEPLAPAASIFKIVTAAALLEAGVPAGREVCYHGGKRRLQPALLKDSARDSRCITLAQAMGKSANVVFAKLAQKHLTPEKLRETAQRLLFGTPLELEGVPVEASPLDVPDGGFEFASTAAGFNTDVRLTPLHGALLAAAIGNEGVFREARIVDAIDGVPVEREPAQKRILPAEVARSLGSMMELTVTEGTARAAFRERRRPALPGIEVAGKTGSLAESNPYRDATWFVGYAPAEKPSIAVASMVINEGKWRIRAPYVARETLRSYLLGTSPYRPPR